MASLSSITTWDYETDVLIVGAGLAGCSAAVAARDADADVSVLILDKLSAEMHGGASRCAAQYINSPAPDAVEDLMDYQRTLNKPFSIDETVLRTWATAVCNNREWIQDIAKSVGREFVYRFDKRPDFPDFPGADAVKEVWSVGTEGQQGVWKTFRERVDQLGIEVINDTAAYELVQDQDTLEVFGMLAHQGDKTIAVKANRGVALTLGGMGANMDMIREYYGYEALHTLGTPSNTGDGLRILQKAGAEMWHVNQHVGGICTGMKVDGWDAVFIRDHLTDISSWIDIGADDERFYDETHDYSSSHFKRLVHGHWRDIPFAEVLPIHMIFDEASRAGQNLCYTRAGWNAVALEYTWSDDNLTEVEAGWIRKADTIEKLAELIGRDPASVRATVDAYNAHCAAGSDPLYGREPSRMVPITQGPFYAVPIVPAVPGTSGGGKRDENARVISTRGTPIPRLYEAGELGSTLCNLYQNGALLTEAIAFGRIAGTQLVAEPSLAPEPTPV